MNQLFPLNLRISSPQKEGMMSVSKWLCYHILLDEMEMQDLMISLENFSIYAVSEALDRDSLEINHQQFLEMYTAYVRDLKEGVIPQEQKFRRYFSAIFTKTSDLLYAIDVARGRYVIKATKPIIQLQPHHFFHSSLDGQFRPMVSSQDSISWGIQFSYPQLFQDPQSHEFFKVGLTSEFPNTSLFAQMVKWMRAHTCPTPFIYQEERKNVSIRLGKKCFKWIHLHPQLKKRGLEVFSLREQK